MTSPFGPALEAIRTVLPVTASTKEISVMDCAKLVKDKSMNENNNVSFFIITKQYKLEQYYSLPQL
jgi:hypothetical protein